jgi:peroxiredoxin Q/BCP
VAKSYGATAPLVGTRRAVFIIDEEGIVRFTHVHRLGLDYLDADQLRDAVAQATGTTA